MLTTTAEMHDRRFRSSISWWLTTLNGRDDGDNHARDGDDKGRNHDVLLRDQC